MTLYLKIESTGKYFSHVTLYFLNIKPCTNRFVIPVTDRKHIYMENRQQVNNMNFKEAFFSDSSELFYKFLRNVNRCLTWVIKGKQFSIANELKL